MCVNLKQCIKTIMQSKTIIIKFLKPKTFQKFNQSNHPCVNYLGYHIMACVYCITNIIDLSFNSISNFDQCKSRLNSTQLYSQNLIFPSSFPPLIVAHPKAHGGGATLLTPLDRGTALLSGMYVFFDSPSPLPLHNKKNFLEEKNQKRRSRKKNMHFVQSHWSFGSFGTNLYIWFLFLYKSKINHHNKKKTQKRKSWGWPGGGWATEAGE